MPVVLFDTIERNKLFPLAYTRAIADIRIGIITLKEWWEKLLEQQVYIQTAAYLQPLYVPIPAGEHIYVDAAIIPDNFLVENILQLQSGESLMDSKALVAYRGHSDGDKKVIPDVTRLQYPWQVFQWNDTILREQFKVFTKDKFGVQTAESTHVINASAVFIEEGCVVEHAVLNASEGPIYIGKNVTIMEGSFIRGPFAIGDNSVIKMGTKIYGATTVGANCVLAGEIKNSVMFDNSNKAHDGYLGSSVIGAWCNLGAGTSNSNLKNTAGEIGMNDFEKENHHHVGNKCGVIMGDYCRTAINSSINTGSMFGVGCNIFGGYLLPKRLPNFSWGAADTSNYQPEKAIRDIRNWKNLKGQELSSAEEDMIAYIFEHFKV